jgi:mannose-6-phosphate isomerase-like protein (cupin superfamily)
MIRLDAEPGTVMHNPITGEFGRLIERSDEHILAEMIAVPGGHVAGPHTHPRQEEVFEVVSGAMGFRRGDERGVLHAGESATVPAGVVHDWWNAGHGELHARVTVTPPGSFLEMIGAVWGLAVAGRTNAKGMPGLLDAALLAEAFGDEIVFERPPASVQRALVRVVAPIARRRGRSITDEALLRSAAVPADRWPLVAA